MMVRFLFLFFFILAVLPAAAQKRSPDYSAAASQFESYSIEQRIKVQVLMTASGYWPAVPNVSFSSRLFQAITNFQRDNGYAPTGKLDEPQLSRLNDLAAPFLKTWGFRSVTHPTRNARLWLPLGLGGLPLRKEEGWEFKDSTGRITADFLYFNRTRVDQGYQSILTKMLISGTIIHYKVLRSDFMAISATSVDGIDMYLRFHNTDQGSIGFILAWKSELVRHLHIERAATLMSASLWASQTGAPFIDPPGPRSSGSSVARSAAPELAPSPSESAGTLAVPDESGTDVAKGGRSSGTGFFVSKMGHVLTNAHVVEGCTKILMTSIDGQPPSSAYVAKVDKINDLALLKTATAPLYIANFRTGARLGEAIAVFGYPLAGVLSTSGNFTLGNITALTGLADDSRHLQISAPVQGGNSGGPLLDEAGNVVGVIVAKLDALRVMVATKGEIPQNVNFAIRASVASAFMDGNGITPNLDAAERTRMNPADLAERAKGMSVYIVCER